MDWNSKYIADLVRRALEEDIRAGDATSLATIPAAAKARELREALAAGAESVLLDNMTLERVRSCMALTRSLRSDCVVEISGGARAYAETGADFLSSGALTHSAPAADLSLLVDSIEET